MSVAQKVAGFTLGRFRLWALGSAADPRGAADVPGSISDIVKLPEEKRSDAQKAELAAYYRTISPALEPTRQRLAELRRRMPAFPIVIPRGKGGTIPVPIARSADFAGPVQVTLEGFGGGRDPQTRQPPPITKNFEVTSLNVDPEAGFARLNVRPGRSRGPARPFIRRRARRSYHRPCRVPAEGLP